MQSGRQWDLFTRNISRTARRKQTPPPNKFREKTMPLKINNVLRLFFLITLCTLTQTGQAQLFKYLTTEDGLSDRRVYSIAQDSLGFLWFLTDRSVDRFDGETFKSYTFHLKDALPTVIHPENILRLDNKGKVWQLNSSGIMYQHSYLTDQFEAKDLRPDKKHEARFTLMHIDRQNRIWTANRKGIYIYDIDNDTIQQLTPTTPLVPGLIPTCLSQIAPDTYYLGTNRGIQEIRLKGKQFQIIRCISPDKEINKQFYHTATGKLVFTTLSGEVYCYNPSAPKNAPDIKLLYSQNDLIVQEIIQSTEDPYTLLIATNGYGIFNVKMPEARLSIYLQADYTQENKLPGDNITALLMDKGHRLWTAVYPIGVIMISHHFPEFTWQRNQPGNPQSLCNNHVNHIIEDHEGDIWYATTNGISIYSPTNQRWSHVLTKEKGNGQHSKIFLTLCEVMPGKVLAGGFMRGSYLIDKKSLSYTHITPKIFHSTRQSNVLIRSIIQDTQGQTWVGGDSYLACLNWKQKSLRAYDVGKAITYLQQRRTNELWIGTTDGLFLLETQSGKGKLKQIRQLKHCYINSLCQTGPDTLYIATNSKGIFTIRNNKINHYLKDRTALPSDHIYSILPDPNGNLICSTSSGLTRFLPDPPTFYNWSSDQGLTILRFNANSGVHTRRHSFIIGSNNGVIELPDTTRLPRKQNIRLYYDRLEVYGLPDSIVQKKTMLYNLVSNQLKLDAENNGFTLRIGCINFDNPNSTQFRWRLRGRQNKWSTISDSRDIRYLGLSPGTYTLQIQAINRENNAVVQEKHIEFTILPPWYRTYWMYTIYVLMICLILYMLYHHMRLQHEQQINRSKMNFFLQMAHDIRTPLTLIKAPLEEVLAHPDVPQTRHIQTALNNADNLLVLANNLLQMERNQLYTDELRLAQQDLTSYLLSITSPLSALARDKHLFFQVDLPEGNHYVWIDSNKLGSILQNLITNAFKYTPTGGRITLKAWIEENDWCIILSDTGYGISPQEKKHIFDLFHTGSAHEEHSEEEGQAKSTGVGLSLVKRLTDQHKGQISMESKVNQGTTFTLRFPIRPDGKEYTTSEDTIIADLPEAPLLLIAEDNEDLRNFLTDSLRNTYRIMTASDGKEAIQRIGQAIPDLILSDVMMEPMSGHELCRYVKNNMSTSHVPVILLTALNDNESILQGLEVQADLYLTKPFELKLLRANLHSVLINRHRIYEQLRTSSSEGQVTETTGLYNGSELDLQFLHTLRQTVKENLRNQEFNVEDLCMAVNMSRSSLFNKIKVLCSMSPSEFIRRQRLDYACQKLSDSEETISEIAYECGFNDGKYFREVFKKYTGISPTDYRNQNKQESNNP